MKKKLLLKKSQSSNNSRSCFLIGFITGIQALLYLFFLCPNVDGQLYEKGIPPSTVFAVSDAETGRTTLVPPDRNAIDLEDLEQPVPFRFAVTVPVNSGIQDAGFWTDLPDGSRIWRWTIEAPGAKAITVYFDQYHLEGGSLFLYNPAKTQVLGAYTQANNQPGGLFATGLIPGDQVTLEYHQPTNLKEKPALHVSEIAYAYRSVSFPGGIVGFGSSGPCEVNVNCLEGDRWQPQKKGVTRIEVKRNGGSYWCSGSLINNTRYDQTPYVLTADHCGQGATPADIQQWIFYFGFESTGCPNPPVAPPSGSMTGATLKAASGDVNVKGSDFLLLLLNEYVPASYNVEFNGWNREDIPSQSGVGIHHPMGDIKKISTYTTPLVSTVWSGDPEKTHWRVIWAQTLNGHGVTEGGSSGSPIFDDNAYIVGTLTGGEASCDSNDLTKPDYYGKFSYHWNSNGSDSALRLDYWLDPDSTGIMVLGGLPIGIIQPDQAEQVLAFPNPVSDILTIKLTGKETGKECRILAFNLYGIQLVNTRLLYSGEPITLDCSSFRKGYIVIKIITDTDYYIRKVFKE